MAGIRRSHRPVVAVVVAGVLALMLGVGAAESAGATTADAATLTLDPLSGSPGKTVAVRAASFGKCSSSPVVRERIDRRAAAGTVAIYWDGEDKKDEQKVGPDGSISMSFVVPESAPGRHGIVARCVDDDTITESAWFEVTPELIPVPGLKGMNRDEARRTLVEDGLVLGRTSGDGGTVQSQSPTVGTGVERGTSVAVDFGAAPEPKVVPNVVRLRRTQAVAALKSAGLRLGRVSGRGDVVRSQSPEAGVTVSAGSPVNVTVGSVPVMVTVPRLIGLTREKAASRLAARWLVLGPVSGDGERVRGQRPEAGTRVRAGSAVSVTIERGVEPPVLIQVPSLVGRKVAVARATLVDLGLVLGGTPAGDRTVAGQQPAPGTLVALRKVVTVTLVAPPLVRVPDLVGSKSAGAHTVLSAIGLVFVGPSVGDRDIVSQQPAAGALVPLGSTVTATFAQSSSPWAALVAMSALLLGAAAGACRALRQRLDQRWVRTRLRIVARQSAAIGPRITESNRTPATPVVRIEPHADTGTHILEEV